MHVLLIGAGGFLGRHLAAALVAAGHTVTGTGRRGALPPGHAAQPGQESPRLCGG
ncbi:MAG TPA: NAD-dependent epimerase/dehydratase family protein, partial [Plasticicumulans sp.]|nr:NAD-dependent epimerase/dehydratase family protein [Plasticicumulans sp.]